MLGVEVSLKAIQDIRSANTSNTELEKTLESRAKYRAHIMELEQ